MPTYNIVQEGADNTGNTAIDGVLDDLVGSNTTIIFPSGTYRLNDLVVPSGMNNLELRSRTRARLVPGRSGDNLRWFDVSGNGFVLNGFELDMRNIPVPPYVRMNSNAANWELKRLITRGNVRAATDNNVGSNNSSDARTYFRLSAAGGSRGLLQDCYFQDGACEPDEASNRRCILVESGNGNIVFNRCWFEHWAGSTFYAKKPAGAMRIYNSFFRNTQNGMRLGGNSVVNNCVSIKNAQHPIQAWSGGSLQRGVNAEATDPTNQAQQIDSYNGTLRIVNSDFNHRYLDSSCGGAITAPAPCQRIDVRNVRVSYDSTKNQSAIYTYEDGGVGDLEYLRLQNVQVRNDNDNEYAIFIDQVPDTWGTVSGVLGGNGPQTNSSFIRNRMVTNGNPTQPITTRPAPSPPPLGQIPMQTAQVVRIDNTGRSSSSTFNIRAGTYIGPGGDDGATVDMNWAPTIPEKRIANSDQASGTVPAGEAYVFYVTGGIVSTSGSGPAIWTVDGERYNPGSPLATRSFTRDQPNGNTWQQAQTGVPQNRVVIAEPLSFNGSQPCHVRLRNVAAGSFEFKLEEWEYLDGSHTTETFYMLAVRPTEQTLRLGNGNAYSVKGGRVGVNTSFSTVSLGGFFDARPVVLTQTQTYNGSDPVVTRVDNVTSNSFAVKLQEEEANGSHTTETVGYVALEQATGAYNGGPFEVRRTGTSVTSNWYHIDFQRQYDSPRFVADMQTDNGDDTAELRYRNLTGSGVDIKVEEEQSADSETTHTAEVVGYAVFEGSV